MMGTRIPSHPLAVALPEELGQNLHVGPNLQRPNMTPWGQGQVPGIYLRLSQVPLLSLVTAEV